MAGGTLANVDESQVADVAPALDAVTPTAMNLPLSAAVTVKALAVASLIALHVAGTTCVSCGMAAVQAYHWVARVGVAGPSHPPRLAVIVLPTATVPLMYGFAVASTVITTGAPDQVELQPVRE